MNSTSLQAAARSLAPPSPSPKAAPRPSAPGRIRIECLDLLRLFAALCLLFFHYAFRGAVADNLTRVSLPSLAPFAKYAFIGVDMFFVISGFVIAGSTEGRTWKQFSVARFARIYPSFVACMTVTFLVIALLGRPPWGTSLSQWAGNLLVVSPLVGVPFMDGAYWSIVYEIVFYGWMALLVGAGAFPRFARPLVFAWLALSMVNELALDSNVLRKLFVTDHSGFFAAGVSLYLLHRGGGRNVLTWMLFGLSVVVASCQLPIAAEWMRNHYRVPMSNVVLVGGALAAIGLVAVGTTIRDVKLRAGVVAAAGGLTYPLYLLHQHAGYVIFNALEGALSAPVIIALTAAIMLGAAWLVWRFVETPSRRAIVRLAEGPRPQAVLVSGAGNGT